MEQFRTWLVCQFCGRAAPRLAVDHWLDEDHRTRPGLRVVRCPQHWSEWALRHTKVGRTSEMRARMAEALKQPAPLIPVHLEPFPTMERKMK